MSDYEVTLVNDNSTQPFPHLPCATTLTPHAV